MDFRYFKVVLTNGKYETTYYEKGSSGDEAVIQAQAEAIQNGRGYSLVYIVEVDFNEYYLNII